MKSIEELPALSVDPTAPYAILADIHSNLEALVEVDRWLDARGLGQVIVLGDVVGYGASPAEVVKLVRRRGWPVLTGNHEEMLAGRERGVRRGVVKERARLAIDWTRRELDEELLAWAASLPSAARIGEDAIAVHGSLVDPYYCYAYIYDLSLHLNVRRLRELEPPAGLLVFHGHTHWPRVYRVEDTDWTELALGDGRLGLEAGAEYFVNPGSVGYPRDGDPRASFMTWNPGRRVLELVRLPYDVEAAAQRIERAGYSSEMAARLRRAG